MRILMVCHGNICRSPMAEFVMRRMAEERGLAGRISVASAATSTEEIGNPVYPPARKKLAEHGIDCADKRAVQLRRGDYARYDFIFYMDAWNLRNILRITGGDPDGKLEALLDGRDIADPWYTGDFDRAYADIEDGCRVWLDRLFPQT